MYLVDVKTFSKQCTDVYSDSTTPQSMSFFHINIHIISFHTRFNNYRRCHRKFCKGHSVIQVSFYAHSMLDRHCGIYDWQFLLIEKGCNKQETRKKSFLAIQDWHICTVWSQWASSGRWMDITEWSSRFGEILSWEIKKCEPLLFDCWCWATWLWLQSCRKPTFAVGYIRDNSWFSRKD